MQGPSELAKRISKVALLADCGIELIEYRLRLRKNWSFRLVKTKYWFCKPNLPLLVLYFLNDYASDFSL